MDDMSLEAGCGQGTTVTGRFAEEGAKVCPSGRIGTTEDFTYGVLYFASDEASFVAGSESAIVGGRQSNIPGE